MVESMTVGTLAAYLIWDAQNATIAFRRDTEETIADSYSKCLPLRPRSSVPAVNSCVRTRTLHEIWRTLGVSTTELSIGILRAIGKPAEVQRFSKCMGDDVVWRDAPLPRRHLHDRCRTVENAYTKWCQGRRPTSTQFHIMSGSNVVAFSRWLALGYW